MMKIFSRANKKISTRRNILKLLFVVLIIVVGFNLFYGLFKPLPKNVSFAGPVREIEDSAIDFLFDSTYREEDGTYQSEQQIFDAIFSLIDNADQYILIDMFLFNDFQGSGSQAYRALSSELTNHLVAKKKQLPSIVITVITDPINTAYGGADNDNLEILRSHGVKVIETKLTVLRDSNPLYSAFWRAGGRWIGRLTGQWFPHPFDSRQPRVSLQSYLDLANFKANHRKVIVADDRGMLNSLIASANPHDGSSRHSNVALLVQGELALDVVRSEMAVADFSGAELDSLPVNLKSQPRLVTENGTDVQLITEEKIREAILREIGQTESGDKIMLAMFYFSDRQIVEALKQSHQRGVILKIVLDPNKDAFGYKKNGIPNRSVAFELAKNSVPKENIRWYDTQGEQFHTKMLLIDRGEEASSLILGSANFTRRNIGNYNLEADVVVHTQASSSLARSARAYFEGIWNNTDKRQYSVDYSVYEDTSMFKYFIYRFQETTGLSSF